MQILAIECNKDHAHIFVNALPKYSPADIMKIIKGNTSITLRKEFSNLLKAPKKLFCIYGRKCII